VHAQDVSPSPIQPGDEYDLLARTQAAQPFEHLRPEFQPRWWSALVRLPGRSLQILQAGFDPANRGYLE
jgi:hypothetical protein